MQFYDQLRWSWRHSKRQLFESILIILAIALGVGVIVTVLSLLLSANRDFSRISEEDYFRTLRVLNAAEMARRTDAPIVLLGEELPTADWSAGLDELEELQNNLPETMHVFVENGWPGETTLLEGAELPEELAAYPWVIANEISFMGVLPAYFDFKRLELARGNLFVAEDVRNQNPVVVLTAKLAEALFGEADPLGREIPVDIWGDQVFYTVIGILAPLEKGVSDGFAAYEESRTAYAPATASPYWPAEQGESRFRQFSIGIDAGQDLALAQQRVQGEAELLWGEDIIVQSPLQDFLEGQESLRRSAMIIGLFASLGLIIAVINILNLMLARVLKRTKSIGLSMALGSSRWLVFRQFVSEASFLGVIGSGLGILCSLGLSAVLKRALGTATMPSMAKERVILGAALGVLVSLLFGAYPAYLASKIDPVDALRTD